jgi:hypothetical protein
VNPLEVGDIVPLVAVNAAFGNGRVATPDGTLLSELCVMSAVTVEVPPDATEAGDALTLSLIHGLKSAVPLTVSQPVLPGPALHPHQSFSAVTTPSTLLTPTVFPTMRLKVRFARPWLCTSTPVALLVIVLPVTTTG